MDGALLGALSAVAGAGITALAGYMGPLRLARSAAEQRDVEHAEQQHREEVERMIALRAAYRDWQHELQRVVDAKKGSWLTASVTEIEERFAELRKKAEAATDALMHDHWWEGSYRGEFVYASRQVVLLVADALEGEEREILVHEVAGLTYGRMELNEKIMTRLVELTGGDWRWVRRSDYPPPPSPST